jgi:hypothetical protein
MEYLFLCLDIEGIIIKTYQTIFSTPCTQGETGSNRAEINLFKFREPWRWQIQANLPEV